MQSATPALVTDRTVTPKRRIFVTLAKILPTALPLILYALLSLWFFARRVSWTQNIFGNGMDPVLFIWMLHWWPFAVLHGFNPFISKFAMFPEGANLTWFTSVPALAFLAAPLTALKGSVFSFNILSIFASAVAAWTGFLLTRYMTKNWPAAVIAGYVYGFSSYDLAQTEGHLHLDFSCWIPLAILLALMRFNHEISLIKFATCLAIILTLQLGTSTEVLVSFCIFSALAWLLFFGFADRSSRAKFLLLGRDIALAAIPTAILASPFLIYLIIGMSNVPDEINSSSYFSADPLNFIIPTAVTHILGVRFEPLSSLFYGNGSEDDAYLGIPMIIILLWFYITNYLKPHITPLYVTLIALILFSLGPVLHILNLDTNLPMPWAIFERLPFLKSALPTRFPLFVSIIAAICTALFLSQKTGFYVTASRFALAIVACLFLAPNRSTYNWEPWPTQAFFNPQTVLQALGENKNVLILPYNANGPGMAWQIEAGMAFTQAGGYVGYATKSDAIYRVIPELSSGQVGADFASDLTVYCATLKVDDILIGPGTSPALVSAISKIGWPEKLQDGVTIISVPPLQSLSYVLITGDYWPTSAPYSWMGKNLHIITRNEAIDLSMILTNGFLPDGTSVSVTGAGLSGVFKLTRATPLQLRIPANSDVLLHAAQTFIPDQNLKNGDRRHLSFSIATKIEN